jgi:predicted amidohydrolase
MVGTLREGAEADLAVLEKVEGRFELVDSTGAKRTAREKLVPRVTVKAGRVYESQSSNGG